MFGRKKRIFIDLTFIDIAEHQFVKIDGILMIMYIFFREKDSPQLDNIQFFNVI